MHIGQQSALFVLFIDNHNQPFPKIKLKNREKMPFLFSRLGGGFIQAVLELSLFL